MAQLIDMQEILLHIFYLMEMDRFPLHFDSTRRPPAPQSLRHRSPVRIMHIDLLRRSHFACRLSRLNNVPLDSRYGNRPDIRVLQELSDIDVGRLLVFPALLWDERLE